MSLVRVIWMIALAIEFCLFIGIIRAPWRKAFARCLAFLVVNLCTGSALFWMNQGPQFVGLATTSTAVIASALWLSCIRGPRHESIIPDISVKPIHQWAEPKASQVSS